VGPAAARKAMALSGADGVMVGRVAQGRPWVLAEIAADLFGTTRPILPTPPEFAAMVAEHYEAMISFYGAELGNKVARKHLGWYMDAAATPAALRKAVLVEADPVRVLRLLPDALAGWERAAA
jgi:tRNA-dihydrouridine synthase B